MSRLVSLRLLLSAGCAWATACGSDQQAGQVGMAGMAPSATVFIDIVSGAGGQGVFAFGVNPLLVPERAIVIWRNRDSVPHTASSEGGVWDSGKLAAGQAFSFRFDAPGTFPYRCLLHGGERGTLIVR